MKTLPENIYLKNKFKWKFYFKKYFIRENRTSLLERYAFSKTCVLKIGENNRDYKKSKNLLIKFWPGKIFSKIGQSVYL